MKILNIKSIETCVDPFEQLSTQYLVNVNIAFAPTDEEEKMFYEFLQKIQLPYVLKDLLNKEGLSKDNISTEMLHSKVVAFSVLDDDCTGELYDEKFVILTEMGKVEILKKYKSAIC